MICTKCGAGLRDSDQFCPKCGTKVIKEMRCPDCGAALREGTKFCHKCGRMVESSGGGMREEDMADIPMDAIERNILSETEAELKADRGRERGSGTAGSVRGTGTGGSGRGNGSRSGNSGRINGPRNTSGGESKSRTAGAKGISGGEDAERGTGARRVSGSESAGRGTGSRSVSGDENQSRTSRSGNAVGGRSANSSAVRNAPGGRKESDPAVRRKSSVPAPPPRGKRYSYRDEEWDDDWDDDEEWEDDDWDDDDDEGVDLITIMTVALGCVILVVVALVGFNLYKQYIPKDYDKVETEGSKDGEDTDHEDSQEIGEDGNDQSGQEVENDAGTKTESSSGQSTYELIIVSNVNVRDQPSTSGTNVLKVAKLGEKYVCKGSAGDGNWYEIILEDGSTGYVFTDYVEVIEE